MVAVLLDVAVHPGLVGRMVTVGRTATADQMEMWAAAPQAACRASWAATEAARRPDASAIRPVA
jgi:hypothetical protein